MNKLKILFLIPVLFILFSACTTFRQPNFALDFQGISTPVMFNQPSAELDGVESKFSSGISTSTVTSSSSYGGATATATISSIYPVNSPFQNQLQTVLLLEPDYIYIDNFQIAEQYMGILLLGTTDELTLLEINTLVAR